MFRLLWLKSALSHSGLLPGSRSDPSWELESSVLSSMPSWHSDFESVAQEHYWPRLLAALDNEQDRKVRPTKRRLSRPSLLVELSWWLRMSWARRLTPEQHSSRPRPRAVLDSWLSEHL